MLNTPNLTIANPLLTTTDFDAITDNQARNILVAFKERQTSINDLTLQQLYTKAKPLGKLKHNGKYSKLKEMSISDMKYQSYIDDPKIEANPLSLRKVAVMPTLHRSTVPTYPLPSVKEIFSQLPDFLQSIGSIFFYTDFSKNLFSSTLDRGIIKYYEGEEEAKKLINLAMLRRHNLYVGETTFFKLAVENLQEVA